MKILLRLWDIMTSRRIGEENTIKTVYKIKIHKIFEVFCKYNEISHSCVNLNGPVK